MKNLQEFISKWTDIKNSASRDAANTRIMAGGNSVYADRVEIRVVVLEAILTDLQNVSDSDSALNERAVCRMNILDRAAQAFWDSDDVKARHYRDLAISLFGKTLSN